MLRRGELRKYAKNSNFENFESALYSTSVSMPLSVNDLKHVCCVLYVGLCVVVQCVCHCKGGRGMSNYWRSLTCIWFYSSWPRLEKDSGRFLFMYKLNFFQTRNDYSGVYITLSKILLPYQWCNVKLGCLSIWFQWFGD